MGRPSKFTEEVAQKLIEWAKEGLHKQVIAWGVGIDPSTLENWLDAGEAEENGRFSQFARDFRAAEAQAERDLVVRLKGLALGEEEGNHQPAEAFLKRRWPKRWGDRAALEHTGADGGPMRHELGPAEIQAAVASRFGGRVAVQQSDDDAPQDE